MTFQPGHIISHAQHGIGIIQQTDWRTTTVAFVAAEDRAFKTRELRQSASIIDGPALIESHCPPDWDAPTEDKARWKYPIAQPQFHSADPHRELLEPLAQRLMTLVLNSVGVFPGFRYSPQHSKQCSCSVCRMPLFAPKDGGCSHLFQRAIEACALCNADKATWRVAAAQIQNEKTRLRIERQNLKIEREMRSLTSRTPLRIEAETVARYGNLTAEVKTREKRAGVGVLPISKAQLKQIKEIVRVSTEQERKFQESIAGVTARERDHALFANQIRTLRSIVCDSLGKTLAWSSAFTVEPDKILYRGAVLNVPQFRKCDVFSRGETLYQADYTYSFDRSGRDEVRFQTYAFSLSDGHSKPIEARVKNTTTDAAEYHKPQKGLPYIINQQEPGRLTLAWNPFEEVAWFRMGIVGTRSVFQQSRQLIPWVLEITPFPEYSTAPRNSNAAYRCEHLFPPASAYCSVCNPWLICKKHFHKLTPKFGGPARFRIAADAIGKYTVKVSVVSLRERNQTIREVIPYLATRSDIQLCPHCSFGHLPSIAEISEWESKAEAHLKAPQVTYPEDQSVAVKSEYEQRISALELAFIQKDASRTDGDASAQIKSPGLKTGNRAHPANSEWREIAYHWIPKLYPDTSESGSAALKLISYIYALDVQNKPATEIQLFEKIAKTKIQPDSIVRAVNRFKENVASARALFGDDDPPTYSSVERAAKVTGTTTEHVLDLLEKGRLVGTRSDSGWKLSLMQVLQLAKKVAPQATKNAHNAVHFADNVSPLDCDVSGVVQ